MDEKRYEKDGRRISIFAVLILDRYSEKNFKVLYKMEKWRYKVRDARPKCLKRVIEKAAIFMYTYKLGQG